MLGATAMIVGAFLGRHKIEQHQKVAAGPFRLVCAPELANACTPLRTDTMSVSVESPSTTRDALIAAADPSSLALDAWLVPAPWLTAVDDARQKASLAPLFANHGGAPVATTLAEVVVWADRATALGAACPKAIDPKCLGSVAGKAWASIGGPDAWGKVKIRVADPSTTGTGAALLGAAVRSFFGRPSLTTNDLDNDDAFGPWFQRLAQSARSGQSADPPLALALSQGASAGDAVVTTEAELDAILAVNPTKATRSRPIPLPAYVSLMLAAPTGAAHRLTVPSRVALLDGLRRLEWRVNGQRPLHADGSESKSSQLAGEFSRALGKRVKMPIHLHDEFLSSADAEEELLALDVSRKKRKEVRDQLAAVQILESYFRSTPPAPNNAPFTPSNGGIL